ncbi:hypothetical protein ACBZ90_01075 (plasmid) [Vibrio alginolyticus]
MPLTRINKAMMLLISIGGVIAGLAGKPIVACTALGVVLWLAAKNGGSNSITEIRKKAAKSAFDNMDLVIDNKRWLGKDATVVKVSNITAANEIKVPWNLQILAKSVRGTWFTVDMSVIGKDQILIMAINELDESTVKRLLANDHDLYRQYFGEPELA